MNKYRAVPVSIGGIRFHSQKEAGRYLELKLLQQVGRITDLELQVKYSLDMNGVHICNYIADFRYTECGSVVVEDTKGFYTPIYRLKKKLMRAIHQIEIFET